MLVEKSWDVGTTLEELVNSYFDNVMTKFMISKRTDVKRIDVNLLTNEFLVTFRMCPRSDKRKPD